LIGYTCVTASWAKINEYGIQLQKNVSFVSYMKSYVQPYHRRVVWDKIIAENNEQRERTLSTTQEAIRKTEK